MFCCEDGKFNKLSKSEKHQYNREPPQVAPDLRDGHYKQSQFSDVYALGRVITMVNNKFLQIPGIVDHCVASTYVLNNLLQLNYILQC